MNDDTRNAILAQIEKAVDKHGLAIICTALEYDGGDWPAAYTVGLTDKGLPEILVLGMSIDQAQVILNHMAHEAIERGGFPTDVPIEGLFPGSSYVAIFRECPADRLGAAQALFVASDIKAVQMIWPDADNRMPWDEGSANAGMPLESATTGVER